jgi:glucose-6-phosphate isomerase
MVKSEIFFQNGEFFEDEIKWVYNSIIEEIEGEDVGYYDLVKNENIESIKSFSKELQGVKNVVVIGIGGSSLGTKAIDTLLCHTKNRNDKNLIFFENVDPIEIEKNLKNLELESSFFIVISKSGGTIETTSHLKFLLKHFDISLVSEKFREHFCFITDSGSPLDKLGEDLSVKRFHIPLNVGGRFSVLSAVGLLPLSLLGYDIDKLLAGADALKESFIAEDEYELCQKALFYAKNAGDKPINVLFSYSSSFKDFNDWFVQLWAESLGKIDFDGNSVGLTPIGLIGSIDQHSFLQLIIEGVKDKNVTLIKVKDFETDIAIPNISLPHLQKVDFINNNTFQTLINAQCDATIQSLVDQSINVDLITIDNLDEKSAGYMIFYYELLTSLVGAKLNINTYNQPGVEFGKVILQKKFEN